MQRYGAQIIDSCGVYDDGWCEPACSVRLSPEERSTIVEFAVWLKPEPDHPKTARFSAQVDLHRPLVCDLPFDVLVHVQLACMCEAGGQAIVSMLCDRRLSDPGVDARPLSFRLASLGVTSSESALLLGVNRIGCDGSARLLVTAFGATGVRGIGAPAGTLVEAFNGDLRAGSSRADENGSFVVELDDGLYDGAVHVLSLQAADAVSTSACIVADPAVKQRLSAVAASPLVEVGHPKPGELLVPLRSQAPETAYILSRKRQPRPATLEWLQRRALRELEDATLSIVMPTYNSQDEWLRAALDSVVAQWAPNWELICVDDCSSESSVRTTLEEYGSRDARLKVISTPQRMGPAGASNIGLAAATGDFIAFLDHDDFLEATAVWKVLRAAMDPKVDLIYSDELLTTEDIDRPRGFIARPAFSHDYYLDHPYFVHLVACRRTLAQEIGGFDETMPISADVDFILRFLERAKVVAHIPEILYRWRTHPSSLGHDRQEAVTSATVAALDRAVKRIDPDAKASSGLGFNLYRVDWPDRGGKVLIVIPTKDRGDLLEKAISSIEVTCPPEAYRIVVIDHGSTDGLTLAYLRSIQFRHSVTRVEGDFNFAAMNNKAARIYGSECPFIVFMNNDVEAVQPNWLERLRSLAGRSDVAAVCPLLLYGRDQRDLYNRVQHGGVIIGLNGSAEHAFKGVNAYCDDGDRNAGYNCSLAVLREFSAVTGACLMMRREVFEAVQGFDEKLRVGFNDTDLCLRLAQQGYKILYDGHTVFYHHESATRRPASLLSHDDDSLLFVRRWAHIIEEGDDFYSPALSSGGADHIPAGRTGRFPSRPARVRFAGFNAAPPTRAEVKSWQSSNEPLNDTEREAFSPP